MLDAAVLKLKADPKATLTVLGSANSTEDLHVATDRTKSVRAYLVEHGIEASRIHLGTDKSGNRTTALWLDTEVTE